MYDDTNATLQLIDELLAEVREATAGRSVVNCLDDAIDPDTTLREIPAACV
ncbi:MAG: hypothetical protein AAFV43_10690 [Planctomycetota bacterium]